MKRHPNHLDYCQYLLVTPVHRTLTNFVDRTENLSHESMDRLRLRDQLTAQLILENVITPMAASIGVLSIG